MWIEMFDAYEQFDKLEDPDKQEFDYTDKKWAETEEELQTPQENENAEDNPDEGPEYALKELEEAKKNEIAKMPNRAGFPDAFANLKNTIEETQSSKENELFEKEAYANLSGYWPDWSLNLDSDEKDSNTEFQNSNLA